METFQCTVFWQVAEKENFNGYQITPLPHLQIHALLMGTASMALLWWYPRPEAIATSPFYSQASVWTERVLIFGCPKTTLKPNFSNIVMGFYSNRRILPCCGSAPGSVVSDGSVVKSHLPCQPAIKSVPKRLQFRAPLLGVLRTDRWSLEGMGEWEARSEGIPPKRHSVDSLPPFFPSTNSLLYAGCRMAFTLGGEESLTPFWVNMERFTRDSAKPPRKIR